MSDKVEERLSALMDDELVDFELDIDHLEENDSLKQRWMRYHLIRDVVSGHVPDTLVPDFNLAARVSAALEHEPTILAPRRFQPRQLMKQAAGLAIAATVSAIAIISIQNPSFEQTGITPLATADKQGDKLIALAGKGQNAESAELVSLTTAKQHIHNPRLSHTSASKFSGYLLNHNEYAASANIQGMLPYMRIVGATQNQPVIIRVADEK
ncbi:hypothetical protein MNBD_GAMMA24-2281 [hydrothermal vent metagenome]|uniref:Anti sigma-E protein RseA N-terminal domain-containing protein n=1 Tax=hydrothermal vent metagenome TaxID=652676 RepID=A0A3B1BE95_9ZZZZ